MKQYELHNTPIGVAPAEYYECIKCYTIIIGKDVYRKHEKICRRELLIRRKSPKHY